MGPAMAEELEDQAAGSVAAVKPAEMSLDEIAKELSNPVTSLTSIATILNTVFSRVACPPPMMRPPLSTHCGPQCRYLLNNGKYILIRASIPINGEQPIYEADEQYPPFLIRQLASTIPADGTFDNEHGHSHLGDIGYDVAYGGVSDNGFIGMFGVAGVIPASQDLSQSVDQFQLGPEVVIGKVTSWGVYGAWLTHLTRVYGEDEWDTNMTSLKIFFAYGLGHGWQVFSNPVIQYDWEGDSDNKLFLPIGAGVSKTTRIGSMPLKLAFEVQKYIVSPDSIGPDWLFTFSFTPAFRNLFQK